MGSVTHVQGSTLEDGSEIAIEQGSLDTSGKEQQSLERQHS